MPDTLDLGDPGTADRGISGRGIYPQGGRAVQIIRVNFLPDELKRRGAGAGTRWVMVPGQKGVQIVSHAGALQNLAGDQIILEYDPASAAGQDAVESLITLEQFKRAAAGLAEEARKGSGSVPPTLFEETARKAAELSGVLNFEDPSGVEGGHKYGSPLGMNPDAGSNPQLQLGTAAGIIAATLMGFADPKAVVMTVALSGARKAAFHKALTFITSVAVYKNVSGRFSRAAVKKVAAAPLTNAEKALLREEANLVWSLHHGLEKPIIKASARAAGGQAVHIHHVIPLEYAHLFPHRKPSAIGNLFAVTPEAHAMIHRFWTMFRRAHPDPTPAQVMQAEIEIAQALNMWGIVAKPLK